MKIWNPLLLVVFVTKNVSNIDAFTTTSKFTTTTIGMSTQSKSSSYSVKKPSFITHSTYHNNILMAKRKSDVKEDVKEKNSIDINALVEEVSKKKKDEEVVVNGNDDTDDASMEEDGKKVEEEEEEEEVIDDEQSIMDKKMMKLAIQMARSR